MNGCIKVVTCWTTSLASTSIMQQYRLLVCTDSLAAVDETTSSGNAIATDVYCNRSLALLHMRPPSAQAALQDACCAIECNPQRSKVSRVAEQSLHVLM